MTENQDKIAQRMKTVREIADRMNQQEKKPPLKTNTGRIQKQMRRIPKDVDFEMKDGNTTFEVAGHFNPNGDEYFINQIIRKLGYKYYEDD